MERKKNTKIIKRNLDRINDLPDYLIHHILSFLLMRDVVNTCLLSKKWRDIWKSVPVLSYGDIRNYGNGTKFIDKSLMHYKGQKIQRFEVRFVNEVEVHRLDSWILFAVEHGVEELDTHFSNSIIPRFVLDYRGLKVLRLRSSVMNLTPSSCFSSLKELHLGHVQFNDFDTSGFPLLEVLIIERSYNTLNIYAPNQKLRHLTINDPLGNLFETYGLTLYAPNLLSIELGRPLRQFYEFKDVSSVKTASLQFCRPDNITSIASASYDIAHLLVELLTDFSHAKSIKLCQMCTEALYHKDKFIRKLKMPSLAATCLELRIAAIRTGPPAIVSLVMNSDRLETLVIGCYGKSEENKNSVKGIKEAWESLEMALSTNLQLKIVVMTNFFGSQSDLFHQNKQVRDIGYWEEGEIKLVKSFLKCCKALNKMIIHTTKEKTRWPLKDELLLGLAKKLLVTPRASSNVEIHL